MSIELVHPNLGKFKRVRVEGTDWIVQSFSTGCKLRLSNSMRQKFHVISNETPEKQPALIPSRPKSEWSLRKRDILLSLENLRNGLPPTTSVVREFAVGIDESMRATKQLLTATDEDGGAVTIFRGAYGNGKTLNLQVAEDVALEQGFLTVRTEIDASENQLCHPHQIVRSLMANLRVPNTPGRGPNILASLVAAHLKTKVPQPPSYPYLMARKNYEYLIEAIGCEQIAWLFSDPALESKEHLLALLTGQAQMTLAEARQTHAMPGTAKQWPAFRFRTQGDIAALILSGLGRLARLLGFKGLLIIFDEMEKWERLNIADQNRGANLLGGLIWGSTARRNRGRDDHPDSIVHSRWAGGFPFTTQERSYVGIAMALTPRGTEGPEDEWADYGPLTIIDLPELTKHRLTTFCTRLARVYAEGYEITEPDAEQMGFIVSAVINEWQSKGGYSIRDAIPTLMMKLDQWKKKTHR